MMERKADRYVPGACAACLWAWASALVGSQDKVNAKQGRWTLTSIAGWSEAMAAKWLFLHTPSATIEPLNGLTLTRGTSSYPRIARCRRYTVG